MGSRVVVISCCLFRVVVHSVLGGDCDYVDELSRRGWGGDVVIFINGVGNYICKDDGVSLGDMR